MNPIKKCFKLSMQEQSMGNLSIRKLWRATPAWEVKPFWVTRTRAENTRFCGWNALPDSIDSCFLLHLHKTSKQTVWHYKKKKQLAKAMCKKMVTAAQYSSDLPFLSFQNSLQKVHNKHKCLPCNKCLLKHRLYTWSP